MRNPILIFMDEPFGALDAQIREQLQEDFLQIWSRTGATVIFVTHSIDEALFLSDRIFVFATELVMWLERRMSRWRQLERERF